MDPKFLEKLMLVKGVSTAIETEGNYMADGADETVDMFERMANEDEEDLRSTANGVSRRRTPTGTTVRFPTP